MAAFAALDAQGVAVDILVNNAGIQFRRPMLDLDVADWRRVIDTNLTAAFLLTQAVGRRVMIPANHGKIVNIASIAGLKGNRPGSTATIAYNTTKGGLISFTRALATEWAPHGITVNAIAPGFFPS